MGSLDSRFRNYYGYGVEKDRLLKGSSKLEFYRTKRILSRYLPKKPATILDIGGATGRYSRWLAEMGHSVHLVDALPLHVRQARQADKASKRPIASIRQGDARSLDFEDKIADIVLLFGPMYHLVGKRERLKALSEASRVLKPGGLVFAAGITRYASILDGTLRGFVQDSTFRKLVEQDLRNGQHRNPTGNPRYFTTAFFHHPDELEAEIRQAGFKSVRVYAIESFLWLMPRFEQIWNNSKLQTWMMKILDKIETDPSLKGLGDHLLGVGRK